MQSDTSIRSLLTRPWIDGPYQNVVGATRRRTWISEHFWRVRPGQKVVDIGCGPGNAIQHLPEGVHYIGFDISEQYIGYARQARAGDPCKTFILGTAEDFITDLPEAGRRPRNHERAAAPPRR